MRVVAAVVHFLDALVRYETSLWNHLDGQLRAVNAPPLATVLALRVVAGHAGRCRVQELRSDLGITVGAASKLVDRLERDGLAVRRANPEDRRSSLVELTAGGRRALERGVAVIEDGLAEHLGDDGDVATVTAALTRLGTRLRAGAAAAS